MKCAVHHAVKVIHRRVCERTIENTIHIYIHNTTECKTLNGERRLIDQFS